MEIKSFLTFLDKLLFSSKLRSRAHLTPCFIVKFICLFFSWRREIQYIEGSNFFIFLSFFSHFSLFYVRTNPVMIIFFLRAQLLDRFFFFDLVKVSTEWAHVSTVLQLLLLFAIKLSPLRMTYLVLGSRSQQFLVSYCKRSWACLEFSWICVMSLGLFFSLGQQFLLVPCALFPFVSSTSLNSSIANSWN